MVILLGLARRTARQIEKASLFYVGQLGRLEQPRLGPAEEADQAHRRRDERVKADEAHPRQDRSRVPQHDELLAATVRVRRPCNIWMKQTVAGLTKIGQSRWTS